MFSLGTGNRRLAEAKLLKVAAECEKEALGILPARSIRESWSRPLTELLDEYVADLVARRRAPSTIRKYDGTLRVLLQRIGWRTLGDVTALSFVRWRVQAPLSARSLNDLLANAQGFLRWLCQHGMLSENALEQVGRMDVRGRSLRRRALSATEVQTLLSTAPFHRAVVYAVALYTGLRRKELTELPWAEFALDVSEPFVRVPASISKNRRCVVLPLHRDVVRLLHRLRPVDVDPAIRPFRSRVPRVPTLRRDLVRAGIAPMDGLGRTVDFHALRVTYGTRLLATKVAPAVVKELMRHSDLRLTMNLYADRTQLPLAQGVAALPKLPRGLLKRA